MARMAAAYEGVGAMEPVSAITKDFNWAALPAESVVVDAGVEMAPSRSAWPRLSRT